MGLIRFLIQFIFPFSIPFHSIIVHISQSVDGADRLFASNVFLCCWMFVSLQAADEADNSLTDNETTDDGDDDEGKKYKVKYLNYKGIKSQSEFSSSRGILR